MLLGACRFNPNETLSWDWLSLFPPLPVPFGLIHYLLASPTYPLQQLIDIHRKKMSKANSNTALQAEGHRRVWVKICKTTDDLLISDVPPPFPLRPWGRSPGPPGHATPAAHGDLQGEKSQEKVSFVQAEGNELVWVKMCKATDDLLIATSQGMVSRLPVRLFKEYKSTGCGAGLKSVKLARGDRVTDMAVIKEQATFLSHLAAFTGACRAEAQELRVLPPTPPHRHLLKPCVARVHVCCALYHMGNY